MSGELSTCWDSREFLMPALHLGSKHGLNKLITKKGMMESYSIFWRILEIFYSAEDNFVKDLLPDLNSNRKFNS